jgi:hypothetical protein
MQERRVPLYTQSHGAVHKLKALTPSSSDQDQAVKISNRRPSGVSSIETPDVPIVAEVDGADGMGEARRRTTAARGRPRLRAVGAARRHPHRSRKIGVGATLPGTTSVAEGETAGAAGAGESDDGPGRSLPLLERTVGNGCQRPVPVGAHWGWMKRSWPRTRSKPAHASRQCGVLPVGPVLRPVERLR